MACPGPFPHGRKGVLDSVLSLSQQPEPPHPDVPDGIRCAGSRTSSSESDALTNRSSHSSCMGSTKQSSVIEVIETKHVPSMSQSLHELHQRGRAAVVGRILYLHTRPRGSDGVPAHADGINTH